MLTSDWLDRNLGNSDIFASFAMQCGLNEYAPEGRPMHEVSPLSNINWSFVKVNFLPHISYTYRVDQKKGVLKKTKIGHGGVFLKKKSMTNKIKKFL